MRKKNNNVYNHVTRWKWLLNQSSGAKVSAANEFTNNEPVKALRATHLKWAAAHALAKNFLHLLQFILCARHTIIYNMCCMSVCVYILFYRPMRARVFRADFYDRESSRALGHTTARILINFGQHWAYWRAHRANLNSALKCSALRPSVDLRRKRF